MQGSEIDFGFKLHAGKTAIRKLKSRRNKGKMQRENIKPTKFIAEFRQLFHCRRNTCPSSKIHLFGVQSRTFWNKCSNPWPFTNNHWDSQPLHCFFLLWFATAILAKMDGNLDDPWGNKSQPELLALKNTFAQGLLRVIQKCVLLIVKIAFSDFKTY